MKDIKNTLQEQVNKLGLKWFDENSNMPTYKNEQVIRGNSGQIVDIIKYNGSSIGKTNLKIELDVIPMFEDFKYWIPIENYQVRFKEDCRYKMKNIWVVELSWEIANISQ